MASASAIRAGSAYVELMLRKNQFVQGLNSAQQQLASAAKKMAAIGAAAFAGGVSAGTGLFAAVKAFADFGDNLDEMSAKTGVSVESLSELKFALELGGSSAEGFEKSLLAMNKALFAADEESKGAQDTLADLGVNLDSLRQLDSEGRFYALAEALSRVEDEGNRAALATQIFGKSGVNLLPSIEGGTEGLKAMREEAKRLGVTLTSDDAKAAAAVADAIDKVKASFKGLILNIGRPLAEATAGIADFISKYTAGVGKFIKENPKLVKIAAIIAGAVTSVGGVMLGLGGVLGAASLAVGGIVAAFTTIGPAITAAGAAIAAIGAPVIIAVAAVTALVGGIAAALTAVFTFGGGWDWLKRKVTAFWDYIKPTLTKLKDRFLEVLQKLKVAFEIFSKKVMEYLKPILDFFTDALLFALEVVMKQLTIMLETIGKIMDFIGGEEFRVRVDADMRPVRDAAEDAKKRSIVEAQQQRGGIGNYPNRDQQQQTANQMQDTKNRLKDLTSGGSFYADIAKATAIDGGEMIEEKQLAELRAIRKEIRELKPDRDVPDRRIVPPGRVEFVV